MYSSLSMGSTIKACSFAAVMSAGLLAKRASHQDAASLLAHEKLVRGHASVSRAFAYFVILALRVLAKVSFIREWIYTIFSVIWIGSTICDLAIAALRLREVTGLKPTAATLPDMAVLTNQQALCTSSSVIAEFEEITSLDAARKKCEELLCSHFTWFVIGAPSFPGSRLQLQLW